MLYTKYWKQYLAIVLGLIILQYIANYYNKYIFEEPWDLEALSPGLSVSMSGLPASTSKSLTCLQQIQLIFLGRNCKHQTRTRICLKIEVRKCLNKIWKLTAEEIKIEVIASNDSTKMFTTMFKTIFLKNCNFCTLKTNSYSHNLAILRKYIGLHGLFYLILLLSLCRYVFFCACKSS